MLSKSITRAARSGYSHNASALIPNASRHSAASPSLTSLNRSAPTSLHQKRPSSSRASAPPSDGHRPAAADQTASSGAAAPTGQAARSDQRRHPGRTRRKSKDLSAPQQQQAEIKASDASAAIKARDEAYANVPAVPSTHHLQITDVKVSDFFALHRPISVTSAFPPSTTDTASFDSIFSSWWETPNVRNRPADIIYTLQNAANMLESRSQQSAADLQWQAIQQQQEASLNHLDGRPPQSIEQMIKEFKPFRPPPAPVPFDEFKAEEAARVDERRSSHKDSSEKKPQAVFVAPQSRKSLSSVLNVTEKRAAARKPTTSPSVRLSREKLLLERMHTLQRRYNEQQRAAKLERTTQLASAGMKLYRSALKELEELRQISGPLSDEQLSRRSMLLISVKRQRKLKMKKHKYKKLMRRTRNLRIREGRN